MADLTRKTANLFDVNSKNTANGYVSDAQLISNGNTEIWGSAEVSEYIPIKGNTKYTFNGIGSYNTPAYCLYDSDKQYISGQNYNGRSIITFTSPDNARFVRFTHIKVYTSAMFVEGSYTTSTMPVFEPYWQHSLRKLATATDTITTLPIDLYADGTNATVGLVGNMNQTGTPTPQNPIQPQECGELETSGTKAGQYKIPISSANTTTPVYLGEVETTRMIRKLMLTGEENITSSHLDVGIFNVPINDYLRAPILSSMCTHYKATQNVLEWSHVPNKNTCFYVGADKDFRQLYIKDSSYSTISDFKAYLATQYAAGTPVTVWYVLAEPTTGIVNEPIRKIGDYADTVSGITIPTTAGADSFDVLTTLKPSEVSLSYTGWHDASVKEWDGSDWQ